MISQWKWHFVQFTRQIWFRSLMFSLLGIVSALVAIIVAPYVPDQIPAKIGADAVDRILSIIASSMLAVTTFSLSTLVAAYGSATSNVTPRATRLLLQDKTSQNVLATFIGAFLFSLVGIIALSTGAYGEKGRFVLFIATLLVIAVIVATLLRWIDYLSHFGRVSETTQLVEKAAAEAMRARRDNPNLGGAPAIGVPSTIPPNARPVVPVKIGYIQHLDTETLQACAEAANGRVHVTALPGAFVGPTRPLAFIDTEADDTTLDEIRDAFTIGDVRSFDQDPRFGLSVLSEIASRALSPAVNDPGTAIDVIGRAIRILSIWAEPGEGKEVIYPNVNVPAITMDELFDDIFSPIARDGASVVEVQIRLQKAFKALAETGDPRFAESARRHSELAWAHAKAGLTTDAERALLKSVIDA